MSGIAILLWAERAFAPNPLIMDQFTADPTARGFEGRIYVYPSHDLPPVPGRGRPNWFCMEDYHAFSSDNLVDWTDHGVILHQTDVPWVNTNAYAMWAPDCVYKNGKYYFYFPASAKSGGMRIGVAIGEKPYGPFKPEPKPIDGVHGIDPCVFVGKDGSAYLFYSMNRIFVAKLKDNMLELDSPPMVITNLPQVGLIEGPFVFERNGIYYLTYPHVQNKIERLEYAISHHPLGPYKHMGVIMDEAPSGCWTVHHSIVEYKGQWYLFYHDNDLSPDFDKNRSMRAERLFFNDDGSIRKVIRTLRGVGVVNAKKPIQIDRYSEASAEGVTSAFLNPSNKHEGWKVSLQGTNAWLRFNEVDFGVGTIGSVKVRGVSPTGALVEIRAKSGDGPTLARVEVPKGSEWSTASSTVTNAPHGICDLFVSLKTEGSVELDWIRFE